MCYIDHMPLREARDLRKDASISWRAPLLIKKVLAFICDREWRTENELGLMLLTQALQVKCRDAVEVFVLFRFEVPMRVGPVFMEYCRELEERDAEVRAFLKALDKNRFPVLLDPRAELECFKAGTLSGMSAELWWALREEGIKPQSLKPGLYEFEAEVIPDEEFREEIPSSFSFKYISLPRNTDDFLRKSRDRKKAISYLWSLVKEGRFRIGT